MELCCKVAFLFSIVSSLIHVEAIKKRGDFTVLEDEPEDLLYYISASQQWFICNINYTQVDLYAYVSKGYLSDECYEANYKKDNEVKYAIFKAGIMDRNLGPPKCPPLKENDQCTLTCENGFPPSSVYPYMNCTFVCNNNTELTVRCRPNLQWDWFGKSLPSDEMSTTSKGVHTTTKTREHITWEQFNVTGKPEIPAVKTNITDGKNEDIDKNVIIIACSIGGVLIFTFIAITGVCVYCKKPNSSNQSSGNVSGSPCQYVSVPTGPTVDSTADGSSTDSGLPCPTGSPGSSFRGSEKRTSTSKASCSTDTSGYQSNSNKTDNHSSKCCCVNIFSKNINEIKIFEEDANTMSGQNIELNEKPSADRKTNVNTTQTIWGVDDTLMETTMNNTAIPKSNSTDDQSVTLDEVKMTSSVNGSRKTENEVRYGKSNYPDSNEMTCNNSQSLATCSQENTCETNFQENSSAFDTIQEPTLIETGENSVPLEGCSPDLDTDKGCDKTGVKNNKIQSSQSVFGPIELEESVPVLDVIEFSNENDGFHSGFSLNQNRNSGQDIQCNSMDAMDHLPGSSSLRQYAHAQTGESLGEYPGYMMSPDSYNYSTSTRTTSQPLSCDQGRVESLQENKNSNIDSIQFSSQKSREYKLMPLGNDASENVKENDSLSCYQGRGESSKEDKNRNTESSQKSKEDKIMPLGNSHSVISLENATARDSLSCCQGRVESSLGDSNSNVELSELSCQSSHEDEMVLYENNSSDTTQDLQKCTSTVKEAFDRPDGQKFFQSLQYQLDPHTLFGDSLSWRGLAREVLGMPYEQILSLSHHTLGNPENGHFKALLEHFIAKGIYLSDIVQYFVDPNHRRVDVVSLFQRHHSDCPVCNRLYQSVNRNKSSPQLSKGRKISKKHHDSDK